MKKILLALLLSLSAYASIGNIMALKGEAQIQRDTTTIKAVNGAELQSGDSIITKDKTRVQVMLKDDTVVTIGPNSSFSFEEFLYDGTKNSKLSMKAERGFFRSVTGKLGKIAPERFKVKTASATIGIRGTDFSADIQQDREIIKCYSGAIFVEFQGELREVDAGSIMELTPQGVQLRETLSHSAQTRGANAPGAQEQRNNGGQISEDELGNITQQAQVQEGEPQQQEQNPTGDEPFYITPVTQDREIQY